MKKFYILALAVLATTIATAQPFSSLWRKFANSTDYTWFTAGGNDVNSLAYNPVTDKLLVAKRGTAIYIVNALTGAEEGQLSLTGVGTESLKYSKIRITTDGVIYAISLPTAPGQCTIYRWANQLANPTLAANFTVTERTGDAFGLSGTGNTTVLYASGAGTTANAFNIYILTTPNGTDFFTESKVTMTSSPTTNQQWANRVVEPVTTGSSSDIWINGGGFNARKISVGPNVSGVRTGTVVTTITDGVGNGEASIGYGGMRLLTTTNGNKFLTFAGGNNSNAGVRMKMLNVNNEAAVTTYGLDSLYDPSSFVTNGNGTGDVSFKKNADNTYTVFYVSTNNGIQATKSDASILPIELSKFSAAVNGKSVSLNWTTTLEAKNTGFEVEKSLNGTSFSSIGFVQTKAVQGNSNGAIDYNFEDVRATAGKAYYRLKQVDKDGKSTYSHIVAVTLGRANNFAVSSLNNPIKGNIQLVVNTTTDRTLQVQVTNATGAVVLSKQFNMKAGNTNLELDANKLGSGVFYVILKDNEVQQVIRLVK